MNEARTGNPFVSSIRVLGLYVRAAVLIFAMQTALYAAGFALIGIPWWGLMALLCGTMGLIPHIGAIMGIALVLVLSGLAGADLPHLGMAAGVWVLVQAIEGFWLTPRLIGRPLGLRPLVVFGALIVGSFAFGPLGFLLAVPVLAVALVWVRYFKGSKPPALPAAPPTSSVQRYAPPTGGTGRGRDK